MKNLSMLVLILVVGVLTSACVPQAKTNTLSKNGSGSQSSTNFASNGSGTGSGSATVVTPTPTATPVVVVTPTPVPTPELTEYCGQFYISKTGLNMFIDEDGHYRTIDPDSYNADQVVNNITFPNDAFNACVHGTLHANGWLPYISAQYIQLSDPIVNPERETNKNKYAYEICGTIMYKTDPGQTQAWLQIKVGTSYKIVDDTSTVKAYIDAHGTTDGCLYNDAGYTYNYYVTYKGYFKPSASSLGW